MPGSPPAAGQGRVRMPASIGEADWGWVRRALGTWACLERQGNASQEEGLGVCSSSSIVHRCIMHPVLGTHPPTCAGVSADNRTRRKPWHRSYSCCRAGELESAEPVGAAGAKAWTTVQQQ